MVAIQDYATRQVQILTQDRSTKPEHRANSKLIIYAAQQGARGILAGVSTEAA